MEYFIEYVIEPIVGTIEIIISAIYYYVFLSMTDKGKWFEMCYKNMPNNFRRCLPFYKRAQIIQILREDDELDDISWGYTSVGFPVLTLIKNQHPYSHVSLCQCCWSIGYSIKKA